MPLLRSAARVLDAWGALVLGVAVVLGVIMLLATPGPWRDVVGAPPVAAPSEPPRDIVVFVRGGAKGDDCTAAVWLHIEHERPSLTAVVVPVQLQVAVPGAGFDRLCRVVRLFGPEAAATALGEALSVPIAGSVSLSVEGLSAAVPTMFPAGDSQRQRRRRKRALEVWDGSAVATTVFRRQSEQLAGALPRVPLASLSVVAVANYALGSDLAESDLDLQQATALARSAREVRARDVEVRALPVVREMRGEGVFWRPRWPAVGRLTLSLHLGLRPPEATGAITTATRPGGVLVVLPAALAPTAASAFTEGLGAAVAESAGPGVEVTTMRCSSAGAARLSAAVVASQPLAVILVAPFDEAGDDGAEGDALAAEETGAAAWRETLYCISHLQNLYQPAVLVVPLSDAGAGVPDEVAGELGEAGLPVVAVDLSPSDGATAATVDPSATPPAPGPTVTAGPPTPAAAAWGEAGRAVVVAAVRACWPAVLAPELPGTRLGVSYAERRTVGVAVLAGEGSAAVREWLDLCGYVSEDAGDGWAPEAGVVRVAYHPGLRRLAVAVAGDLGVPAVLAVEDADAPAPVTVVP